MESENQKCMCTNILQLLPCSPTFDIVLVRCPPPIADAFLQREREEKWRGVKGYDAMATLLKTSRMTLWWWASPVNGTQISNHDAKPTLQVPLN
jgi:hypothetical protein